MFLSWLFFCILLAFCACSREDDPLHAYAAGDIIIGGLFPIHIKTDRNEAHGPLSCSGYDVRGFLQSQMMIYAIREVNQRMLLPNFTIGYDIYDTCGDVSFAITAALQLLKNQSDPQRCLVPEKSQTALPEPTTKAVIGERFSEISIAVARVVALSSVAQISYASTSEQLSRKLKFPTFLRTISSDEHQTKAIVKLVYTFNWKTVAIVGSDDEYGKYGSDKLEAVFDACSICVEFVDILPGDFSQNNSQSRKRLDELVGNISASTAEAIIMFTKDTNVVVIMEAVIKNNLKRTWIASDAWSTSTRVSTLPGIEKAGEVFGFISKRNDLPQFKDYVMSVFNGTTNAILKHHLTHYPVCSNQSDKDGESNCTPTNSQQESKQCVDIRCLARYIDQDESYNIYLAVQVIVEGLRRLLKCDDLECKHSGTFTAMELLKEIRKVNLTVNSTHIFFDHNGDPSLGYDILQWTTSESNRSTQIKTIAEYWPDGNIMNLRDDLVKEKTNVTVTVYNCSKTCQAGHELKIQGRNKCCKGCFKCADGDYSAGNGKKCEPCGKKKYSAPQRDECLMKHVRFLEWSDPFAITLNCLLCIGLIVCIMFTILFIIHRSTPIVKAVGGNLCFLELFSLLVCFCLTTSFIGKPTAISCRMGMPVFGIAFTLCISCILANLLQILVGFNFDLQTRSWIKKLNQPLLVVTIISGIQVAVCVSWLCLYPPAPCQEDLGNHFVLQCSEGSDCYFLAMLGYCAILAVSCFVFAFKSKQLPDLYKNASLITTSMTLFLIVWIVFIPIYFNLKGKYKRAIESAAILISAYSILGCHLAPKCYIMVFRKEINNEKAITENIRKHFEQKNTPVVKS